MGQILVLITQMICMGMYCHWWRKGDGCKADDRLPCAHLANMICWFIATFFWFGARATNGMGQSFGMAVFWGWMITMWHFACYLIMKRYNA